jgi:adenylate kinase
MRLVLLGPPGGGKGTQAVRLASAFNVPHIATGDLFRAEMAQESELGKLAREYIAHGNLVPDVVVNDIMRARMKQPDAAGYVLDGFPRTLEQAEVLDEMLEELARPICVAVNIEVPDDKIVERAVGREVCPNCNAVYHLTAKPPRTMGLCDNCRGVLVVREDDQPSTVRHRLGVYHRLTEPVIAFYRKQGVLKSVNGIGAPDEVFERIYSASKDVCP